jgi:hypothetical protein
LNLLRAPTFQRTIGKFCVLWFEVSNCYSVIDFKFKSLLDLYLSTGNLETFKHLVSLKLRDNFTDSSSITKIVEDYLVNCNTYNEDKVNNTAAFDGSKRVFSKSYKFKSLKFNLHFNTNKVLQMIHPAIAHLEIDYNSHIKTYFDIFLDTKNLCLFKNKVPIITVPKRDYHLIQGKFIVQLLNAIYKKEEQDWIATLHGCTIAKGENAILLIGATGKGKSTLSTILASHGFELVADDVSALSYRDLSIYNNPFAISVKSGAFSVLKPMVSNFDALPLISFNQNKGALKYIPFQPSKSSNYPCKAILLVNFDNNAASQLKEASVSEVLETLIPDSWLSPNPEHARAFLDWLTNVSFYKLNYSNNSFALKQINNIFETLS